MNYDLFSYFYTSTIFAVTIIIIDIFLMLILRSYFGDICFMVVLGMMILLLSFLFRCREKRRLFYSSSAPVTILSYGRGPW
jgi:uncharacterized membrane protein YkgB